MSATLTHLAQQRPSSEPSNLPRSLRRRNGQPLARHMHATAREHDWRAHAFRQMSRLLLVLAAPAVLAIAVSKLDDALAFRVAMGCLLALIVGVAFFSRDSKRTRVLASALVAGLISVCLTSLSKYGLLPGTALGLSAAVVLVGAFLGSRAVWGFTAVTTLLILAIGAGVQAGLLHPLAIGPGRETSAMAAWLRFAAIYFVTTSFVSATVAALMARLESALLVEREARKAADEARSLREEFLTISAHELRTPATSLQLALQALLRRARREGAGEEARAMERMLDIAEREVSSLKGLVEALLDAVQLEEGPVPVVLAEVDLGDSVRSAVGRLAGPLRASGSALTLDAQEAVVGNWDRSRVEQVATNLLSNAIKYGQGRDIVVRVAAEGDLARLVVTDHGMGIAREAQARVFGRFERAVSVYNFGGFGLGLYVVRRVVERLGGTVTCESVLDAGSTFTVTLPRQEPKAQVRRLRSPSQAPPMGASRRVAMAGR